MTDTKMKRLLAIKEEFARTQAALMKARQLEEAAKPVSLSTLLENDLDQAELILAAQDLMHKLQNMAEDLAKMNAQDLFPLVDKMKGAFGPEAAHTFEVTSQEAISDAMNTVRHAKDELGNAVLKLEGKIPANDMASDEMASSDEMAPADDADAVDAAMDDFGAADAAAGPEDEPLGRARKESVEGGKALNESLILESAGRRLIKEEGLSSLISWVLNEAAAGMPEEHFRSFATSIAQKAASDPAKLAGWIGKKKHGMAAMVQLAEPTFTQDRTPDLGLVESRAGKSDCYGPFSSKMAARADAKSEIGGGSEGTNFSIMKKEDGWYWSESVNEGKTYKRGEDADMDDVRSRDVERKAARRRKGDDKVDEGKTYKANDDEDSWEKKSKDVERKSARKRKGDDKLDETVIAAHAIARLIEASIKRENKGNAAKAVKEAVSYLAGKNLVEGSEDLEAIVVEAFVSEFGMKPAAYSVSKLREFSTLNPMDKKNGNSALAKLGSAMGNDKTAATKSVSSAMTGLTGQERTAATKILNQLKKDGNAPKNAGDFAQKAASLVSDDKQTGMNESEDPNGGWVGKVRAYGLMGMNNKRFDKTFKNGAAYMAWADKHEGNVDIQGVTDESSQELDENINAAHWPVDTMGQYKGEPFSTDYGKLKANPSGPAKTEGGAPEPKVEEAPTAEEAPKEEPKTEKPKAKKSKGNPFVKNNESDSEASEK
jgi:hypothetical protein